MGGTRSEESWAYPQRHFSSRADEILRCLLDVSQEIGRPPAQIALRWVLGRPAITAALVGARSVDQLRSNLEADLWALDPEVRGRLDEVSHLPDRYPEAMEKNMHEKRDGAVDMPSLSRREKDDA